MAHDTELFAIVSDGSPTWTQDWSSAATGQRVTAFPEAITAAATTTRADTAGDYDADVDEWP